MAEQRLAVDWVTPLLRGVGSAAKGIMDIKAQEAKDKQKQLETTAKAEEKKINNTNMFLKAYGDILSPASAEGLIEGLGTSLGMPGVDVDPNILRINQNEKRPFTKIQGIDFGLRLGMNDKEALAFGRDVEGQSKDYQKTILGLIKYKKNMDFKQAQKQLSKYDKTAENLEKERDKAEETTWEMLNNYNEMQTNDADPEMQKIQIDRAYNKSMESLDDGTKAFFNQFVIPTLEGSPDFRKTKDGKILNSIDEVLKYVSETTKDSLTAKEKTRLRTAMLVAAAKKQADKTLWKGFNEKTGGAITKERLLEIFRKTINPVMSTLSPVASAYAAEKTKGLR